MGYRIVMLRLYYILFIFLFLSCKGNTTPEQKQKSGAVPEAAREKTKYVNSLRIDSPAKNTFYSFNDVLEVKFSSQKDYPIDSTQYFLNGKQIGYTGKDISDFRYQLTPGKAGLNTLKILSFHPGDQRGIVTLSFRLKPDTAPQKLNYDILKVYPHDPKAYTQGLVYQDGLMYESTGQYGESGIRKSDLEEGKTMAVLNIDSKLFGEGITIYEDKIYQLTWTSGQGFVYDLKNFTLESTFTYNTQGWGITTQGNHLIMSDGSHKLYHISPSSFGVIKEVEVYDHNGPVERLNELEYIDGLVWANVWMTDRIVIIDPETGVVKKELDMSRLLSGQERKQLDDSDDVLNGIAWNADKKSVYLTGKRWPKLFEIKIREN